MGDRCYISFEVAPNDVKSFKALAEKHDIGEKFDEDDGEGTLADYEANYGYYDQIAHMVLDPDCIPFTYDHGSGGDYGSGAGAYMNGEHYYIATNHDGVPVVEVMNDGEINQAQLERVREYQRVLEQVHIYQAVRG